MSLELVKQPSPFGEWKMYIVAGLKTWGIEALDNSIWVHAAVVFNNEVHSLGAYRAGLQYQGPLKMAPMSILSGSDLTCNSQHPESANASNEFIKDLTEEKTRPFRTEYILFNT